MPKGIVRAHESSFLALLPAQDRERLVGECVKVKLHFGSVLYRPGQPVKQVYFPAGAVISILKSIDEDSTIEVGMVGSEGMLGPQFIAPSGVATVVALVQGTGEAWQMAAASFIAFRQGSPLLRELLHRNASFLFGQAAQSTACVRFHVVEQRLARWLMMMSDRTGSLEFPATQEFLAYMLGVRRASVTEAVTALKAKQAIDFRRRDLTIIDRTALAAAACSCYASDRAAYESAMTDAVVGSSAW